MSIQSEITRISGNITAAFTAIINKGVTVPSGSNSDDLATLIGQITGGGGSAITISDTLDAAGGTVRTITAVDLSSDTVTAAHLETGYTAHDAAGNAITGQLVQLDTSDANAVAGDMRSGKSGYVNGVKVTGNLPERDDTDLTASGDTVTVPPGIYDAAASKSVAAGTEGTPVATKSAVNNHSVTVTPSVTNTAGYISGGTKNGTAVTVMASELISFSTIRTGSSAPSSSLGADGDIYIQTS